MNYETLCIQCHSHSIRNNHQFIFITSPFIYTKCQRVYYSGSEITLFNLKSENLKIKQFNVSSCLTGSTVNFSIWNEIPCIYAFFVLKWKTACKSLTIFEQIAVEEIKIIINVPLGTKTKFKKCLLSTNLLATII